MTRKNTRRSAQEAFFAPSPIPAPPDEKKAVERTETPETGATPVGTPESPADIIRDEYGIEPNCTNVPQILRAILCEMVRRRV